MNFINETFLDDLSICDELINYFNESENKLPGAISTGVDEKLKKATEIKINLSTDVVDNNCIFKYFESLKKCVSDYITKYPLSAHFCNWEILERVKMQYYKPNEAFYAYHCERSNNQQPYTSRHLVFMTYLNTVKNGGETEFYHQKLKINPEKGKTIIWPADWTYTHRGLPSPTEEKYIITGWFNYSQ